MKNYLLKNKKIKNICLMCFALICTLFSFCLSFGGNTLKADAPTQVRVIYSNANVYSLTNISDENNKVIATYKYNQKFNTIGDVITGEDGYEYYKVEISVNEYTFGYVFKSQVADASISSPQIKINYKATVTSDCKIYNLNGNNYEETGEKLTNGTKVRILSGYNKSQEYTQIQYLNADGEIVVSYIKTTALKTSGISRTLIGTILIIITTASLVLIIFGVKGKKGKSRK